MTKSGHAFLVGVVMLALTYPTTRHGNIAASIAVFFCGGYFVGLLSRKVNSLETGTLSENIIAFSLGVVTAQTASFGYYYFDYGRQDAKLSVGVSVMLIEAGVAVLLGIIGIVLSRTVHR
jgi:hypothetical protein